VWRWRREVGSYLSPRRGWERPRCPPQRNDSLRVIGSAYENASGHPVEEIGRASASAYTVGRAPCLRGEGSGRLTRMFRWLCSFLLLACWAGYAQVRNYTPVELPKLEKFDVSLIDKSKDSCTDFFQYACSKWIAAHPIPADMPATSVVLPLYLYNQTILRNALEAAADAKATGSQRQIGDFWTSCMDDSGRDAHGKEWLQPHLSAIDRMKSKRELARVLSYLHVNFRGAWEPDDNSTKAPGFGF